MKKSILIILAAGLTLASCKKLTDLNVDTKNAENGDAPSETLFANAVRGLVDQVETPSVNLNVIRCCTQYWTETTYTDESNYNLTTRKIPDFEFQAIYRDVLSDFKEAEKLILSEGVDVSSDIQKKNRTAVVELLMAYAFQRQVDIFGNVPYSEALNIDNVLPKYDDAQSIYSALFARVDAAIKSIDVSTTGFTAKYDVIYGGNMTKWKAFGNSLKLKLAITAADVAGLDPKTKAAEAVAGGVISSSQSATYQYLGASPNANPVWVQLVSSGRSDWVAANTLVDKMNTLNDPRRAKYFDSNIKETNGDPKYVGGTYGSSNDYDVYTHITPTIQATTWKGNLLDYSEVQFYLAEAAARGFISTNTAQFYYNEAITSSILFWGGTPADATTYLAQTSVDYANAGSGADFKEKIGTQAWIALFERPDAAWNTFRRLDFPKMNIPTKSKRPVPNRYTYPINEQTLNGANYGAAASAIGGDLQATKLFWDKN